MATAAQARSRWLGLVGVAPCLRCEARLWSRSRGHGAALSYSYATAAPGATPEPAEKRKQMQTSRADPRKTYAIRRLELPGARARPMDVVQAAERIQALLAKGERQRALDTVRQQSKDAQYTVSWNHLIRDSLQAGKVAEAFRTFTEMRDRGQKPDAYTYSALMRGLATHVDKVPSAVERVLSLIGVLQSPDSQVALSTYHVNAAIAVCAKARNLDAIYSIAAKIPTSGPASPDHVTYTMILECLRVLALRRGVSNQEYNEEDLTRLRHRYIVQGKRIWADVLSRWGDKSIKIDETLVHAMGRLLLLGGVREHDAVLSLVAQTMNVPRAIPPIGDPGRQTHIESDRHLPAEQSSNEVSTSLAPSREGAPSAAEHDMPETYNPVANDVFQPTVATLRLKMLPIPRNLTLQLLLSACGRMKALGAAQKYWDQLSPKLELGLHDFHEYLRLLRERRNSRLATELMRQICTPKEEDGLGLQPQSTTFRLAMGTCVRDGNNQHSIRYARELLGLQRRTLDVPDPTMAFQLVSTLLRRSGQWPLDELIPTLDALDETWKDIKVHTNFGDMHRAEGPVEGDTLATTGKYANSRHGRSSTFSFENGKISAEYRSEMAELTRTYYKLLANTVERYREQLTEKTFRDLSARMHRNRNKIVREKMRAQSTMFTKHLQLRDRAEDGEGVNGAELAA